MEHLTSYLLINIAVAFLYSTGPVRNLLRSLTCIVRCDNALPVIWSYVEIIYSCSWSCFRVRSSAEFCVVFVYTRQAKLMCFAERRAVPLCKAALCHCHRSRSCDNGEQILLDLVGRNSHTFRAFTFSSALRASVSWVNTRAIYIPEITRVSSGVSLRYVTTESFSTMAAPREAAWYYDPLDAAATVSIYLDHFT